MKKAIKKSKYKASNILKKDMILIKKADTWEKKSSNFILNTPANQT